MNGHVEHHFFMYFIRSIQGDILVPLLPNDNVDFENLFF